MEQKSRKFKRRFSFCARTPLSVKGKVATAHIVFEIFLHQKSYMLPAPSSNGNERSAYYYYFDHFEGSFFSLCVTFGSPPFPKNGGRLQNMHFSEQALIVAQTVSPCSKSICLESQGRRLVNSYTDRRGAG